MNIKQMHQSAKTITPSTLALYQEYIERKRTEQSIVGCIIAITLVPLFSLLDYVIYPNHWGDFLIVRLLCAMGVLGIMLVFTSSAPKTIKNVLLYLWPFLIAISISWMIFITEGDDSRYYAGLNLVIICICLLLPLSFKEAIIFGAIIYLMYLALCIRVL